MRTRSHSEAGQHSLQFLPAVHESAVLALLPRLLPKLIWLANSEVWGTESNRVLSPGLLFFMLPPTHQLPHAGWEPRPGCLEGF